MLIQVADETGNALLPGAVDYESIVETPAPTSGMPTPSGDDLYILYTGGTTGMPKGVLWRQHDIFVSAMGGSLSAPMTRWPPTTSLPNARRKPAARSVLLIPPFMHGAAQWASFHIITMGGRLVIPDDVERLRRRPIAGAGRTRTGAEHPGRR